MRSRSTLCALVVLHCVVKTAAARNDGFGFSMRYVGLSWRFVAAVPTVLHWCQRFHSYTTCVAPGYGTAMEPVSRARTWNSILSFNCFFLRVHVVQDAKHYQFRYVQRHPHPQSPQPLPASGHLRLNSSLGIFRTHVVQTCDANFS